MRLRSIVAPLLKWFAENARDLPWRRTRDPYAIWVSEIMLQQTQVKTVIPYWERWMNRLPDVAALANVREDTVIKLWEGLGYYSRVRNMQKAARLIPDEHGGHAPRHGGPNVLLVRSAGSRMASEAERAICKAARSSKSWLERPEWGHHEKKDERSASFRSGAMPPSRARDGSGG